MALALQFSPGAMRILLCAVFFLAPRAGAESYATHAGTLGGLSGSRYEMGSLSSPRLDQLTSACAAGRAADVLAAASISPVATSGAMLFSMTCLRCHNPIPSARKRGKEPWALVRDGDMPPPPGSLSADSRAKISEFLRTGR